MALVANFIGDGVEAWGGRLEERKKYERTLEPKTETGATGERVPATFLQQRFSYSNSISDELFTMLHVSGKVWNARMRIERQRVSTLT